MIGQASLVGRMHSLVIWKGVLDMSEVGFRAGYDEIWTLGEQIKILWNFSVVCANSPYEEPSDAKSLSSEPLTNFKIVRDDPNGITEVQSEEGASFVVKERHFQRQNTLSYWVDNKNPAAAGFVGDGWQEIIVDGRKLFLRAHIEITSTQDSFHAIVNRSIHENGLLLRQKTWDEVIPRDFQ
jgi:hypothetical protein